MNKIKIKKKSLITGVVGKKEPSYTAGGNAS
jgi:hypothetical protein